MLLQNNCTNTGAIRWKGKIQDSVLFYIVRGGGKIRSVQPPPKAPSSTHSCFVKKKKKETQARTEGCCPSKRLWQMRNKVVEKKKKMMAAQSSFEGSPAQHQRVGTTSVCAPKSTTTKFCCTMHVWKRRPALLKKLCPPALCDKNQVPSMCLFFFFLVSSNGLLKGGKGGGCSWGARTGHERKFVEEKISLYRGRETNLSRLQLDDTPGKRRGHGGRGLKERPQFLDECGRLERRNKLRSGGTERSLRERGEGGRRRRGEG